MPDQIISQAGYDKMNEELEFLIKVKRKEIAERIERAKDMGDLSENAEYTEAKDAQAFNEGRIVELKHLLKNVKIVEEKTDNGKISMGSRITVRTDGNEKRFMIVSFNEVDPAQGKISNESPLGEAFLGKKVGDKVTVNTPKGQLEYEILKIE